MYRNIIALALLCCVLLGCVGCTGTREEETKPTVITEEPTQKTEPVTESTEPAEPTDATADSSSLPAILEAIPVEDQLALMLANRDSWMNDEEMYGTMYNLTVTDLDHNGRLELLFGSCMGSGLFTYVDMWEVSPDGSELVGLHKSYTAEYSQADMICQEATVYYDQEEDTYYYIFTDVNRNGWMWSSTEHRALWLKDGVIRERTLGAYVLETDESYVTHEHWYDAEGNEISMEMYEDQPALAYDNCQELHAMMLWHNIGIEEVSNLTDEDVAMLLTQAADSFLVD